MCWAKLLTTFYVLFLAVGQVFSDDSENERIYDRAIRSTVIVNNIDSGLTASGVLIDKTLKLLVTNQHVVRGADRVDVIFPVFDVSRLNHSFTMGRNRMIVDRAFYLQYEPLSRILGYYVTGRIIAEDYENDLAIVSLESVPHEATEINIVRHCETMNEGDPVHILGHPDRLGLWRWTGGHFQGCDDDVVRVGTTTIAGNSGGPVLDAHGYLIGIHSRSDRHMSSFEIPAIRVVDLVSSLKAANVYSIENRTTSRINFTSWMASDDDPESFSVEPETHLTLWNYFQPTPEIRFDYDMTKNTRWKRCRLESYRRHIVPDDASNRLTRRLDARKYHFVYIPDTLEIEVRDSEHEDPKQAPVCWQDPG